MGYHPAYGKRVVAAYKSSFLIGIWVIVYILSIYEEPYVKIPRYRE